MITDPSGASQPHSPATDHDSFLNRAPSARLGREFRGVFVAEDANGLLKLLHLERLFQNRDRAAGENAIEHFAVGVAGDDNDREGKPLSAAEQPNKRTSGRRVPP